MGTALVMEHANALAQMIVSEKDKLFDERVEALVKLYRRAEFYLKQISGEHRLRVPSEESGNDYAGGNKRRDYGNTEVIKTAF